MSQVFTPKRSQKFRVDPNLKIIWLYSAADVSRSSFSSSKPLAYYRQASLRSSRPKSMHRFPGFCRSLASSKIRIIQNKSIYRKLFRNKNEKQSIKIHNINRPDKENCNAVSTAAGGATCMNGIFKLSITLFTYS